MGRLDLRDPYRDEDLQGRGRAPAAARESVSLAATLETEGRDNGTSARVRPAVPLEDFKCGDVRNPDVRQVRTAPARGGAKTPGHSRVRTTQNIGGRAAPVLSIPLRLFRALCEPARRTQSAIQEDARFVSFFE